jgi:inner membrane protein
MASIGGINILQDYRLLPIILIASLLPDIDHTKSIIGKIFFPIAKAINRRYGHRTITHSLVVLVPLVALISAFQSAYFPSIKAAQVFGLAYGSHIIFDMVTVQGVPIFYPFRRNPCVLPGNPELRMRTNSIRQETVVFCLFMVSAIFLQPLFANGFWTSYNSLFGTLKHIVSEHNKSKDLMIVDFTLQHGSDLAQYKGLCVAVSSSELTILTNKKQWEQYPKDGQQIKEIFPTHTKMNYSFEQGQFHEISVDSLHSLFRQGKYTSLEITGNHTFLHIDQGIEQSKKVLSLSYPNELIIREKRSDKDIEYLVNPGIQTKEEELNMYRTIHKQKEREYQLDKAAYDLAKLRVEQATEEVQKELFMIEFAKMKAPTPPDPIDQKLNGIEAQIREIRKEDQQKYHKALKDAEMAPLVLSGSYERLLINGRNL